MTTQFIDSIAKLIEALSKIITSLVWPILVLVFFWTYRKSIAVLLRRLVIKLKKSRELELSTPFGAIKLKEVVDQVTRTELIIDPDAGKKPTDEQVNAAKRVAQLALDLDPSVIRQQIFDFVSEYENIRLFMSAGEARTREMERVITKMRVLALTGFRFLPELTESPSVGAKLAAVAFLQVKPNSNYLLWLARFIAKDPGAFHGYHAAVAMLYAARYLPVSDETAVREAIKTARDLAGEGTRVSDAFKVLDQAESEL
jgi:hypothetical protein